MAPEIPEWVDRTEYPFTPHRLALPAGQMRFVDEGQGQPVLSVHGMLDWSFGWRHLIKALSPRPRCITPDHLGFGHSEKPFLNLPHCSMTERLVGGILHLGASGCISYNADKHRGSAALTSPCGT
jgi:pimeloyl-ACP methyl ester carboxylesterase